MVLMPTMVVCIVLYQSIVCVTPRNIEITSKQKYIYIQEILAKNPSSFDLHKTINTK